MKWEELFLGKCFISDLGDDQIVENGDKEQIVLGRYAAWAPISGSKNHRIVEIGKDLEALMRKYNVPQDRVCVLI